VQESVFRKRKCRLCSHRWRRKPWAQGLRTLKPPNCWAV